MLLMGRCVLTFVVFFSIGKSYGQSNQVLKTKESQSSLSKINSEWDLLMGGMSYVEGQDESQIVQLQLRSKADLALTESFKLNTEVRISLNSMRAQSRFENPNFNIINLMELAATYKAAESFELKVGALNQDHLGNRMFIADRSFPGVLVQSGVQNSKASLYGKFQYAIPTSTSLESDRTKAEALPGLSTAGADFFWKPKSWLQVESDIHYFSFENLPSVVAFQSARLGNQVVGNSESESFFVNEFSGYTAAHKIGFQYSSYLQQAFKVSMVENLQAPEDRRRSQLLGTELIFDFESIRLSPAVAMFYAESDSTPALYSAFEFGRNNRQGQLYALRVDFKKSGFSILSNYVKANLLKNRAVQKDMSYLEVVLEVKNVGI